MNRSQLTTFATFVGGSLIVSVCVWGAYSKASAHHADPARATVRGKLNNGLSYVLMPNGDPKGKISLVLEVQAGSLNESDAQRSAAHFLEHMAFCGTTHYAPGKLEAKLNQFDPRHNAHLYVIPGYDNTVYKLDLPDAKADTIATGLDIMADWAGGMLLPPAEIEATRTGILAELTHFDKPEARIEEAMSATSYAGTVAAKRPPLGDPAAVKSLDRKSLENFYNTWYRPESMVLVAVGGVDPKDFERQVRERLGKLADRAPAQPSPDMTTLSLTNPGKPAVLVDSDDGAIGTKILVERVMVKPASPTTAVSTVERERNSLDTLRRQIAEQIFSRRIQAMMAKDGDLPIANASMFSYSRLGFAQMGLQAVPRQKGEALPALALAMNEYRRMLEFGPTEAELAVQRTAMERDLDAQVSGAGARQNADLATEMAAELTDELQDADNLGHVGESPAQRRDRLMAMLQAVTRQDVLASLKAFATPPGRDVVILAGQTNAAGEQEQAVRAAYARSMVAAVTPPSPGPVNTWAYGDLPEPGRDQWMTERPDEAAAGIKVLWSHPNGLRMQVRRSASKPGEVLVALRFDLTNSAIKAHRPVGVGELIERGLAAGGLGRHSAEEVAAIFGDSSVRFTGVHVSDDAITYTAACNGKDLTRALQLLRAYYGDPGWRKEAELPVKQAWLNSLAEQQHDVNAQVARRTAVELAGPDAWRRPATAAEVKALGFADAQKWLNDALDNATLTITVAGDVPAHAENTVALWFAPYQVKARFMMASIEDARASSMQASPLKPGVEHVSVDGPAHKAVLHVVWPTDDNFDLDRTVRLDVLAHCLGSRLDAALRAKFGRDAHATAWSATSDSFRGEGQIHALVTVSPDQADEALTLIRAQATGLEKQGVDQKLLDTVRAPLMKTLREEQRSNEWWSSTVLPYAGWQPFRISWATNEEPDYRSIKVQEVDALAARYLVDAKMFAVVGVSHGTVAALDTRTSTPLNHVR